MAFTPRSNTYFRMVQGEEEENKEEENKEERTKDKYKIKRWGKVGEEEEDEVEDEKEDEEEKRKFGE